MWIAAQSSRFVVCKIRILKSLYICAAPKTGTKSTNQKESAKSSGEYISPSSFKKNKNESFGAKQKVDLLFCRVACWKFVLFTRAQTDNEHSQNESHSHLGSLQNRTPNVWHELQRLPQVKSKRTKTFDWMELSETFLTFSTAPERRFR